ncbi:late competence development ComFB family protein [Breznakiellaceae bacterium SP9]
MIIHNTREDIVFHEVTAIFESLKNDGNPEKFCTCEQCKLDTACFVLNRLSPCYIVSNRGVARVDREARDQQQLSIDVTTLIYQGLHRVKHNQRSSSHDTPQTVSPIDGSKPVYNIPAIIGRVFNGVNFAPLSGLTVELRRNRELVRMKNDNWQNPYHVVNYTRGTFTFWPRPETADELDSPANFEYSVSLHADEFSDLSHYFKISLVSEKTADNSFSMNRTFKLPDLYMFPLGIEENDELIDFPD